MFLTDYLEAKIRRYLKDIMKKDFEYDEERRVFIVNEKIGEGISWKIFVNVEEEWVFIYAPLLRVDNLSKEIKYRLFEVLLWLNNEYADTSFQYDRTREIILVSNEIHADSFVYDVFEEKYEAIINAIKVFLEEGIPDLREHVEELKKRALEALYL